MNSSVPAPRNGTRIATGKTMTTEKKKPGPKPPPPGPPLPPSSADNTMNLSLMDPPRWGWTAIGGISDVLPPHERSRRRSTCLAYRKDQRRRKTMMAQPEVNPMNGSSNDSQQQQQQQTPQQSSSPSHSPLAPNSSLAATITTTAATTTPSSATTTAEAALKELSTSNNEDAVSKSNPTSSNNATSFAPPAPNVANDDNDEEKKMPDGNDAKIQQMAVAVASAAPPNIAPDSDVMVVTGSNANDRENDNDTVKNNQSTSKSETGTPKNKDDNEKNVHNKNQSSSIPESSSIAVGESSSSSNLNENGVARSNGDEDCREVVNASESLDADPVAAALSAAATATTTTPSTTATTTEVSAETTTTAAATTTTINVTPHVPSAPLPPPPLSNSATGASSSVTTSITGTPIFPVTGSSTITTTFISGHNKDIIQQQQIQQRRIPREGGNGRGGKRLHWKTIEKMNRTSNNNGIIKNINVKQAPAHKFGLDQKFLGMSISKQTDNDKQGSSSSTTGGDGEAGEGETKLRNKKPPSRSAVAKRRLRAGKGKFLPKGIESFQCNVKAVSDDGVLDMYSYHRGREGMEPRDPESGELLCTHEMADTNHDWDAPKMTMSVVVQFPLMDDDEYEEEKEKESSHPTINSNEEDNMNQNPTSASSTSSSKPYYRETIDWDLSDTRTQSPMDFASEIGGEYGLSFGQMMDLATSIQKQIDGFVQQHFTYSAPLSNKDPNDEERRYIGPTLHCHRYGQALSYKDGGIRLGRRSLAGGGSGVASSSKSSQPGSVASERSNSSSKGRKRNAFERYEEVYRDEALETVEDELLSVVRDRARSASVTCIAASSPSNEMVGALDRLNDFHCHICHKKAKVCYRFGCGIVSHVYCEMHCNTRLGIGKDGSQALVCDFCPVCSLACTCSKCKRKLENVAREFKRASNRQGVTFEETKFDDILGRCAGARDIQKRIVVEVRKVRHTEEDDEERNDDTSINRYAPLPPPSQGDDKDGKGRPSRKSGGRGRISGDTRKHTVVPKAPLVEFPREVNGLIELEPGTPDDYLRVYTNEGSYLVEDFPESWAEASRGSQSVRNPSVPPLDGEAFEDGNVDYCIACEGHGSLLCCDTCPRAFHRDCVAREKPSRGYWECHVCKKERNGFASDLVGGKKSMNQICATLLQIDPTNEANLNALNVLSKIHEMLLKLMDYDFGYMFAEPVANDNVEGYRDVVKNPMDLGTICSKLINGGYVAILNTIPESTLDDVLVAVLKDIELVWNNCYLFNLPGSAVYRMATVVSRRAHMICQRSFESQLSEFVKREVREYATSCETERGKGEKPKPSGSLVFSTKEEKALRARKPRGRHKITVKKGGITRPVAVVDPALGRVVKIYSTVRAAMQAVQSIEYSGHQSEWYSSSDHVIKSLINRSTEDPSVLIFGYRWVMLHLLRAGKVIFNTVASDLIEMKIGDSTLVFMSAEEALSFPKIPKHAKIEKLRERLQSLARGVGWVEVSGIQFRRPEVQNMGTTSDRTCSSEEQETTAKSNIAGSEKNSGVLERSKFVKEDLVSGRKLVGFNTFEAAYEDWLHTIACSPTFPVAESKSMEHFNEFYLGGDRNVDGLYWRGKTIPNSSFVVAGKSQSNHVVHTTSKTEKASVGERTVLTPKNGESVTNLSPSQVLQQSQASATMFVPQAEMVEPTMTAEPALRTQIASTESQVLCGKRKRLDEAVPPEDPIMKKVNGSAAVPNPLGERRNFRDIGPVESTFAGQSSSVPNPLADMHVET